MSIPKGVATSPYHCEVCGRAVRTAFRCADHWACDKCGSQEHTCYYGKKDGVLCDACREKQMEERIAAFHGDTDYQGLITCPWCGETITDSWEYNQSDGDVIECGDCGRNFSLHVVVDITYSTRKVASDER